MFAPLDSTCIRVMARTYREAQQTISRPPDPAHLLLVLLDEAPVAEVFAALSVEPTWLRRQIYDYLAALSARVDIPRWRRIWWRLFRGRSGPVELMRTVAHHHAEQAGKDETDLLDLLGAFFTIGHHLSSAGPADDVRPIHYRMLVDLQELHPILVLRRHGVTTARVLRYLAHGEAGARVPLPTVPPSDPVVEVLCHNDSFTTREFVATILRDEFEQPSDEADRLVMKIHREGLGSIGLMPSSRATAAIERVQRAAEAQGYPLKITLRAL